MSSRLAAFTIIDTIVSLIISSVVIGIVYYFLFLVNVFFINSQKKARQENTVLFFEKALSDDLTKCRFVRREDKNSLILEQPGKGAIRYTILGFCVIRFCGESNDTMDLHTLAFDTGTDNRTDQLVSGIDFIIELKKSPTRFLFNKVYSAQDILSIQNEHVTSH